MAFMLSNMLSFHFTVHNSIPLEGLSLLGTQVMLVLEPVVVRLGVAIGLSEWYGANDRTSACST